MPHKILLVDDEKDILDMLKYNLEKEGYEVLTAHDGKKGLDQAQKHPDVIVLDTMMPEMDGREVCRHLKNDKTTANIPVLFLTAKGSEIDEVVGLELGADDYIIKPISIRKFLARIRVVVRRLEAGKYNLQNGRESIKIDHIEINARKYTVKIDGQGISLTKKEFETLLYLAQHRGQVITRDSLLNAIWGENVIVVDRTIDVHIRKIREKLGKYEGYIETVKGVGYRFKE
jgi:two-component system, OmpR family, alkaline phosphatase synthesis response regulator PhoP